MVPVELRRISPQPARAADEGTPHDKHKYPLLPTFGHNDAGAMREVGIIGAGMIGSTLARLLALRGHSILIGMRSQSNPRLADPVAGARHDTAQEATVFGAATIVAVPFAAWTDLAWQLHPVVAG